MNKNPSRELYSYSLLHSEISHCFVQMSQQDEPCPPESQSLLDETDAPSMSCTRRKLAYSNGRSTSAASQGASEKNQKRGEAPSSAVIFLKFILPSVIFQNFQKAEYSLFVGFLILRNKTEHRWKYDESKA